MAHRCAQGRGCPPDLSSWNTPRGQATRVACLTWQCHLLIRPNLFYTGGGQHTRWIGIGPHRVGGWGALGSCCRGPWRQAPRWK